MAAQPPEVGEPSEAGAAPVEGAPTDPAYPATGEAWAGPFPSPEGEGDDPSFEQERVGAVVAARLFESGAKLVRIGRFTVLRKLGQGGMGVVYAAYDPELDRKVAIKVLIGDAPESGERRERVLREARAMAQLNHPNVVSIHEIGTHKGRIFLAMEFVEGHTLSQWIGEKQRRYKEVLGVLVAAGRGLAAAHAAGLVHRDFKPDNVMVGGDGRIRVMDFGLVRHEGQAAPAAEAVTTDESDLASHDSHKPLTRTGALLGTPAYMSPEQYAGKATGPETDQFAFCVSLHECLFGERPFEGLSFAELGAAILGGEVRQPPRGSGVPAWIFPIVRRGFEVDPGRRWPSMDALLEALEHDPTIVRRRWLLFGAGAAAIGVAAVGGQRIYADHLAQCSGGHAQIAGVWDDSRRAEIEQALLATELSFAGDTWERVHNHLDEYGTNWVSHYRRTCEASRDGAQSAGILDLRASCLERARARLTTTIGLLRAADRSVTQNAVLLVTSLPDLDKCADVELLRAELERAPDPDIAGDVSRVTGELARAHTLAIAGRHGSALFLASEMVAEAEALGYGPLIAEAQYHVGDAMSVMGRREEAERWLVDAYRTAVSSGDDELAARTASDLVYEFGEEQSRLDEADRWAADARAWSARLDDDAIECSRLNHEAPLRRLEGDYQQALSLGARAVEVCQSIQSARVEQSAYAMANLAIYHHDLGNLEEAHALIEQALEVLALSFGDSHPRFAIVESNLAELLTSMKRGEEARTHGEHALASLEAVHGPHHHTVARAVAAVGMAAHATGDNAKAARHFDRAAVILERYFGPSSPTVAAAYNNAATARIADGDYEGAESPIRRALELDEASGRTSHVVHAQRLGTLANVLEGKGLFEDAKQQLERSIALSEPAIGQDHPWFLGALTQLAGRYLHAKQYDKAHDHYARALARLERNGSGAAEVGEARFGLARTLAARPGGKRRSRADARAVLKSCSEEGAECGDLVARVSAWLAAQD